MEIRIYYESLEQSDHFVKPLIQKSLIKLKKNFSIISVPIKKQNYSLNNKCLSIEYSQEINNILFRKNPDIIISGIKDDQEIPILFIEFSTAAYRKDHELQRADNLTVAMHTNATYIKISPTGKIGKEDGGDSSYDYIQQFAKFHQLTKKIAFHIDWETDSQDDSKLIKDTKNKSVPIITDSIKELFYLLFMSFCDDSQKLEPLIAESKFFSEWLSSLKNYKAFEEIKKLSSQRTKWFDSYKALKLKNVFVLKINRFTHGMDPERGMIHYYGVFYRSQISTFITKFVCNPKKNTWYKEKVTSKRIEKIKSLIEPNRITKRNLFTIFSLTMKLPNANEFVQQFDGRKKVIDITAYIKNYQYAFNAETKTIFQFSDILHITDGGQNEIFITWDKTKFSLYEIKELPEITELAISKKISEDYVTYSTIHDAFKTNNIEIISVSYPGAQSDTPILPFPDHGREQERNYVDVIGIKNNLLILQENKGSASKKIILTDVNKMHKFKNDDQYINAVVTFKKNHSLHVKKILIGIGFAETKNNIKIMKDSEIGNIDYFFVVSKDMRSWCVFTKIDKDEDPFDIKSGKTSCSGVYEIKETK